MNKNMALKSSICGVFLASSMASSHATSLAINLTTVTGRGDRDAPAATANDFLTQNPDGLTELTTTVIDSGSLVTASFGQGIEGVRSVIVSDGFTISGDSMGGTNGFNAGDASFTDVNPILEGFSFDIGGETITISGLAALSNMGDTITLGVFGVGDNAGQGSSFTATYGTTTTAETFTFFGSNQGTPTGFAPVVNFSFPADGTTDEVSFLVGDGGRLNAFSISVTPVPEPSTALLAGLGALALLKRRRR